MTRLKLLPLVLLLLALDATSGKALSAEVSRNDTGNGKNLSVPLESEALVLDPELLALRREYRRIAEDPELQRDVEKRVAAVRRLNHNDWHIVCMNARHPSAT